MRTKLGVLTTVVALIAAVFAVGLGFGGPANAFHPSGPVGYWPFDVDGADPTADVAHGNDATLGSVVGADGSDPAYDCTLANIAPTPGNVCGLEFDGSDDFGTVPNAQLLDVTSAYTLSAWLSSNDTSLTNVYRPILVRGRNDGTDANDIEVYIQANTKDLIVAVNRDNGGAVDFVGFVDPPLNTIFHLAVRYDGANVNVFYDGVSQAVAQQSTVMNAPIDTNRDWLIGTVNHDDFDAFSTGRQQFFDGLIDEVRIYNRALSDDEIRQLATTFTITKTLELATEETGTTDEDGLIDLFEEWAYEMKVTLTNNGPGTLDVVVIDPLPGDNELGDGTSLLKNAYDVKDPNDSNGVCPNGELAPTAGTAEAFGTGNSAKCHVTWTLDAFGPGTEMLTINTSTDVNPAGLRKNDPVTKQEYTSTGPYCINQGATITGTIVGVPFEQDSNGLELDHVDAGGLELQFDLICDGAIVGGTAVPLEPALRVLIFVSSSKPNGNLGGIAGADTICNNLATAAGLPGAYKAWLADSNAGSAPASTFFQSPVPYVLPNGDIVADDWADLTDGSLDNAINVDETGAGSSPFTSTWTNVTAAGLRKGADADSHCNDWTVGDSSNTGRRGINTFVNAAWTDFGAVNCGTSASLRLYCVGQGLVP